MIEILLIFHVMFDILLLPALNLSGLYVYMYVVHLNITYV